MCLVGLEFIGLVSGRSKSPVGIAVVGGKVLCLVGLVSGRSYVW